MKSRRKNNNAANSIVLHGNSNKMEVQNMTQLKSQYHWNQLEVIKRGGFAHISKIVNKKDNKVYAMKTMFKGVSTLHNLSIKREKIALEHLTHRNILKLHAVFEDNFDTHFVLDFMPKDLLYWVQRTNHRQGLEIDFIQYWGAEIILALEYMRTKGYVHRDLKTENILISEDFHAKIADFGTAKKITDSQGSTILNPNSWIGTRVFLAPEVVFQEPVTYGTDLWGLAIILSETCYGYWVASVFDGESDEEYYERLDVGDFDFPEHRNEQDMEDLIKLLMRRDPAARLGTENIAKLKRHYLFEGISWQTLHDVTPPATQLPEAPPSQQHLGLLSRRKLPTQVPRSAKTYDEGASIFSSSIKPYDMGRPSDDRPVYRSENPRLRPGYGSVESLPSSTTPTYFNQAAHKNQAPDPEGTIFPHPQGRPELNQGRNAEGMQQFEFDDVAHADATSPPPDGTQIKKCCCTIL